MFLNLFILPILVTSLSNFELLVFFAPSSHPNLFFFFFFQFKILTMKRKCDLKHPPGDEIYRSGTLSMFEVSIRA